MQFRSAEDRLNPITPDDVDEGTLGGYSAVHGRAASFEGCDGEPYTAAIETDETGDAGAPWAAYLVFVRWAATGTAIMGHIETGDLVMAANQDEARGELEALPLTRVKQILDETIELKKC
jgi:hypothetical protein